MLRSSPPTHGGIFFALADSTLLILPCELRAAIYYNAKVQPGAAGFRLRADFIWAAHFRKETRKIAPDGELFGQENDSIVITTHGVVSRKTSLRTIVV
jgi:hypothetical protein